MTLASLSLLLLLLLLLGLTPQGHTAARASRAP